MDLDKMLRDDRCRGINEVLTFEPDLDYSPDAGNGLLSPISYMSCMLRGILRREIFFAPPWFRNVLITDASEHLCWR